MDRAAPSSSCGPLPANAWFRVEGHEPLRVDTFGTGDAEKAAGYVKKNFDFRPARIIDQMGLLNPLFHQTTNYGHFGRTGLPWEC